MSDSTKEADTDPVTKRYGTRYHHVLAARSGEDLAERMRLIAAEEAAMDEHRRKAEEAINAMSHLSSPAKGTDPA